MYSSFQDPGQLAYSARGEDSRALNAFFRDNLGPDRRWFRKNRREKEYRRPLTKAECHKLGYPEGSWLSGHRLSNGQIMWLVSKPKSSAVTDSPETIAAAVTRCPAFGKMAGESAVSSASVLPTTNGYEESQACPVLTTHDVKSTGGVPASPTSNVSEPGMGANPAPAVGALELGTPNTPVTLGTDGAEPTGPIAASAAPSSPATGPHQQHAEP